MSSDTSTSLNVMAQGTMPTNETDPPAQNERYAMPCTQTNPLAATLAFALPPPDIDNPPSEDYAPVPPAQIYAQTAAAATTTTNIENPPRDEYAPVPPTQVAEQTAAAYDDMENAIKETMSNDAPISPAEIASEYNIMENAIKTSMEDNENGVDAPLPPSTAADGLDDDQENQNQKLRARIGAYENDDAARMAAVTPSSGNRSEATILPVNQRSFNELPLSSPHLINNPRRQTRFWRRSQPQRQPVEQSAPPEGTIPPPQSLPPSVSDEENTLPPPTLEATLVQSAEAILIDPNQSNASPNTGPVYMATQINSTGSPWWKRYKNYFLVALISVMATAIVMLVINGNNGSRVDTQPNEQTTITTTPPTSPLDIQESEPISSTTSPMSVFNLTIQSAVSPSFNPSPVLPPSNSPTNETTIAPTITITLVPVIRPTSIPVTPSLILPPTNRPTTNEPTRKPTLEPTTEATTPEPTPEPTSEPTPEPTAEPSNSPTNGATAAPTTTTTLAPVTRPTSMPVPATLAPPPRPALSPMEQLQSSVLELVPSEAIAPSHGRENVAMYGDTVIVGAPYNNNRRGFALVYIRDDKGKWSQQAKLEAPDGADYDNFGWSVAIHGNTVIVGAYWDDDNGTDCGSVDVFVRNGGTWMHQAKLLAPDGDAYDRFGYSVGIFDDTVIIGAPGDNNNDRVIGFAHLFVQKNGIWTHQAKLTAPDGTANNHFGWSVGIFDNTVIVGAPGDNNNGSNSGSAHLFALNEDIWTHQTKVFAPDGEAWDYFGYSVGIYLNTIIVGAIGDRDNGSSSGSAQVFALDNNIWTHQAKIVAPDGAANDLFGFSVGVYMDTVVVGSHRDDDNGANGGSFHLFTRSKGAWDYHAKLLAPKTVAEFGQSVVTYNGTIVAGSEGGEVYVFSSDLD